SPAAPDMRKPQQRGESIDAEGNMATARRRRYGSGENIPGTSSTSSAATPQSPRRRQQQIAPAPAPAPAPSSSSSQSSKRLSPDDEPSELDHPDKKKRARTSRIINIHDLEDIETLVASYGTWRELELTCGYKNLRGAHKMGVLYGRWRVVEIDDPNGQPPVVDPVKKKEFEEWMRQRKRPPKRSVPTAEGATEEGAEI
ncbi:hypothetical protein HK102_012250, partial [Quaeritorhiza haematococci]